ncbi:Helix-turn-helix, AraC domain-containing protein (plasmid) [Gemmatirosa kalamazoonensis]|uniref:Helix-turn-helix, AraC domain-containing protein n=1 Tax=Gemmatirosa kalamazoonensis TaxID=861299 RepID=W0RR59_9BACT|nr:helix-turn-helix transcriptional regulator [Gemmatirosa kalamazoonensis]AHG92957.1 Helix-turn-helix, AraC domain-containing protein [Gemmatirosa kalamazoonensis]
MNRVEVLLRTPEVTLSVFDHPSDEAHADPSSERASVDAIAFVEAGTFEIRPAGRDAQRWRFAPGMLFAMPRGAEFACRHACERPIDRCLSVAYAPDAVEDLLSAGVAGLRPAAVRGSARHRFLRHRLHACARDGADALRLELVAGALFESLDPAPDETRGRADGAPTDVMRRIARTAERVEAEFARPLALRDLAGTAGMSPYHFARVFRRLTGLPPHRYVMAVRLREAVRRLDAGMSVTATCYAVGFASLSHFVTTFRRRFGVSPSALPAARRRPTALRAALAAPVWEGRS